MKKTPGSKGSSVQKQERTAVKPPVNQLYRDTPFISNIKFRCSLPEVRDGVYLSLMFKRITAARR